MLTISPAHLGIKEEYWLLHQPSEDDLDLEITSPYQKAITTLQKLPGCCNAETKVACLIETAKAIVDCVNEYHLKLKRKTEIVVGGDELLPIFSYVVIKASDALPFIYSEACFMEQFMSESAAIEQGGYLVATFHTSLSFLCCLDKASMETTASQILEKVKKELIEPLHDKEDNFLKGSKSLLDASESATFNMQQDTVLVNSIPLHTNSGADLISFD